MEKMIRLSICIPTYNRADALEDCLESIVKSKGYDDELVEIVVSDNHSSDATPMVVERYADKYKNVVYNRNKENIGGERNFIKVLSLASGKLLKLHNDYCIFTESGIDDLLRIAQSEDEAKSYIFLDSRQGFDFLRYECPSMDVFVQKECMYLSWISSFVFWKKDFDELDNKDALISMQFMQTDWALRLYQKKEQHVIYFCDIFRRNPFKEKRGGFNFINVFSKYPQMFVPYVKKGILSEGVMNNCCKMIFENLLLWYYRLSIKKDSIYTYDTRGNFETISNFREKYKISKLYYLLFVKVIVFDILPQRLQRKIRVYFLLKQQRSLL